jgi:hypothetical protein
MDCLHHARHLLEAPPCLRHGPGRLPVRAMVLTELRRAGGSGFHGVPPLDVLPVGFEATPTLHLAAAPPLLLDFHGQRAHP